MKQSGDSPGAGGAQRNPTPARMEPGGPTLSPAERRVRNDLLALLLLLGAFGAPLIGPLRETVQQVTGLSRFQLGAGVFFMGLAAGGLGLAAVRAFEGTWHRIRFIRAGAFSIAAGTLILAGVRPGPGLSVIFLAFAWFLILLGGAGVGLANAAIIDLYRRTRPHRGVILLHAGNALGKVGAPLLVLAVGTSLRRNGAVYFVLVTAVALMCLSWPRQLVADLAAKERGQRAAAGSGPPAESRLRRRGRFWAAACQFAFIAGSEAGVTSILGSFIYVQRPSPLPEMGNAAWAAAVVLLLQVGIAAGRFLSFALAERWSERAILAACLPFVLFALPLVFCPAPWGYAPAALFLGIAFSGTWPAFFALAQQHFPAERSAFTMAARLFTLAGVNGCILMVSLIGNRNANLGLAVLAGAGILLLFAAYLLAPAGRGLCRTAPSSPLAGSGRE